MVYYNSHIKTENHTETTQPVYVIF